MKAPLMTIMAFVALTAQASAQNSPASQNPAPQNPPASGGVVLGSTDAPTTWHETCVEVEIGGSKSYNCINEKLRQQVDKVNPSANIPPIDAKSQSVKIGLFNEPGVREQYGQNFGHSVFPYRPPPPNYGTGILGRR